MNRPYPGVIGGYRYHGPASYSAPGVRAPLRRAPLALFCGSISRPPRAVAASRGEDMDPLSLVMNCGPCAREQWCCSRNCICSSQMAEVSVPKDLFEKILRLIDGLRPPPAPA
jgi:hypothetical protein